MAPIMGTGLDLHLPTEQILALRKAIAIALACKEPPPVDHGLTPLDRGWLGELDQRLWPARPPGR